MIDIGRSWGAVGWRYITLSKHRQESDKGSTLWMDDHTDGGGYADVFLHASPAQLWWRKLDVLGEIRSNDIRIVHPRWILVIHGFPLIARSLAPVMRSANYLRYSLGHYFPPPFSLSFQWILNDWKLSHRFLNGEQEVGTICKFSASKLRVKEAGSMFLAMTMPLS